MKRKRTLSVFDLGWHKALLDMGMGILYVIVAAFIVLWPYFMSYGEVLPSPFNKIFACLCLVYGCFRLYRGIRQYTKKKYHD